MEAPTSWRAGLGFILVSMIILSQVLLRLPNPLRFYFFFAYAGITLLIATLYSFFAHPLFYLVGRHDLAQYTTSMLWWYITAPVVGIRVKIEGEDILQGWGGVNRKSCVFAVNHQSQLDVLLLARLWQPHSIASATWWVRRIPVYGTYLRLCRTIFVDAPRALNLTNATVLARAADMLRRESMNIYIFPEGTLSHSKKPSLLPFKRGAVVIAMEAGNLPLVPIVISNSSRVLHVPERHFQSGTIRVKVLQPIETDSKDGETEEDMILRVLGQLKENMYLTLE